MKRQFRASSPLLQTCGYHAPHPRQVDTLLDNGMTVTCKILSVHVSPEVGDVSPEFRTFHLNAQLPKSPDYLLGASRLSRKRIQYCFHVC